LRERENRRERGAERDNRRERDSEIELKVGQREGCTKVWLLDAAGPHVRERIGERTGSREKRRENMRERDRSRENI